MTEIAARPELDVAIVGAGPYGIALAAAARGLRSTVFGHPLETWKAMDSAMQLRAAPLEMSLSAGSKAGSLEEWLKVEGGYLEEPMRVNSFLSYGSWFIDRFVPALVAEDVVEISEAPRGRLAVATSSGTVTAKSVVVSVGITPFAHAPPQLAALVDGDRMAFATKYRFSSDQGSNERVAVVGGGQSAVEAAVLSAHAGAETTLIARRPVSWFADREPSTPRGPVRRRIYEALYPAVGYGPPPLNRLVLAPDLFAALPTRFAKILAARMLRPGASPWLRGAVDEHVLVREGVVVNSVNVGSTITLTLSDRTTLEVDRLLLGTGFRFQLHQLGFLSEKLRSRIMVQDDWPVLDRWFRSSDPRIRFVGYAAEGRFGPISRFVLGVPFTTSRVAASLDRGTR